METKTEELNRMEKEADEFNKKGKFDEEEALRKQIFDLRCGMYSNVKILAEKTQDDFNSAVSDINKQMTELTQKRVKIYEERFAQPIKELSENLEEHKSFILDKWSGSKTKQFDFGKMTMRINQSAVVKDSERLIEALTKKELLNNAVKTFDTSWLKKAIDTSVVGEKDGVVIEDRKSLVLTKPKV